MAKPRDPDDRGDEAPVDAGPVKSPAKRKGRPVEEPEAAWSDIDDRDHDEEDDAWYDDEPGDRSEWSPSPRQRSIALKVGLAVLVVAVVALLVINGRKNETKNQDTASNPTSGATSGSQPDQAATPKAAWPTKVSGRPTALGKLGGVPADASDPPEPGVYLWSGFDGWHLWAVGDPGRLQARGTITSDDTMTIGTGTAEKDGNLKVDGKTLTFDLSQVTGPVVGFKFAPGFFSKKITVQLDGEKVPLHIGSKETKTESPYTAEKLPPR